VPTMSRLFDVRPTERPKSEAERSAILAEPGFGVNFTDHMATATWTADRGWHDGEIGPYRPFQLDPAAAVLHYAQEIFEGLKAYRHEGGSIWLFRPERNAERFARSAARLALPALPPEEFLSSVETLITTDQEWVPSGGETSLYVRPFMFASEIFLGVRPARHVTYACIASPAGAYFTGGIKPVSIWLSTQYLRAAPRGGMGAAKTGGNYAASLVAQQEAADHGCDQVLFLDGAERTYLEELGGMNVFLINSDRELITPELSGAFLEGVVRDSVLRLAADRGLTVVERQISITELLDGITDGRITEGFACGTAAVITPIGVIKTDAGEFTVGDGQPGPHTLSLRSRLLDIQYGRADDPYGWMHKVC
jgi:branched-chain amino acid aminotransferase